jgi:hypothetical protein
MDYPPWLRDEAARLFKLAEDAKATGNTGIASLLTDAAARYLERATALEGAEIIPSQLTTLRLRCNNSRCSRNPMNECIAVTLDAGSPRRALLPSAEATESTIMDNASPVAQLLIRTTRRRGQGGRRVWKKRSKPGFGELLRPLLVQRPLDQTPHRG